MIYIASHHNKQFSYLLSLSLIREGQGRGTRVVAKNYGGCSLVHAKKKGPSTVFSWELRNHWRHAQGQCLLSRGKPWCEGWTTRKDMLSLDQTPCDGSQASPASFLFSTWNRKATRITLRLQRKPLFEVEFKWTLPRLVSSPRHLFTWYESCRPGKGGRRLCSFLSSMDFLRFKQYSKWRVHWN